MSNGINLVWNFCKQTQRDALRNKSVKLIKDKKSGKEISMPYFFSKFEMNALVSGSSKELGVHSQSIQAVAEEYTTRRKQFKNILRWRGKNSLGWIPFKASAIKVENNYVIYNKYKFSFWNSRILPADAEIKSGSFAQDKRGRWYLNITFDSKKCLLERVDNQEMGIYVGGKSLAHCSNGKVLSNPCLGKKFLLK